MRMRMPGLPRSPCCAVTCDLLLLTVGAGMALPRPDAPGGAGSNGAARGSGGLVPLRVAAGLVVLRLVVMPMVGLAIVGAAVRVGMIPGEERLLILFLLMQVCRRPLLVHPSPLQLLRRRRHRPHVQHA